MNILFERPITSVSIIDITWKQMQHGLPLLEATARSCGGVSHVPLAATKIVARKIMTCGLATRARQRGKAKLSRIW